MFSGAYCLLDFGTEQFFKFYEYSDSDSLKLSLYYSAMQRLPNHIQNYNTFPYRSLEKIA